MKHKGLYLVIAGIVLLLLFGYAYSEYGINERIPQSVIGTWTGKHKVTVRIKEEFMKYNFIPSPDSTSLSLTINENGFISGTLGTATFKNCIIKKNRSEISKKLDLYSDYVITGKLSGVIFPTDPVILKEISFPLNLENNCITGCIFQKDGTEIYPMTNVNLTK